MPNTFLKKGCDSETKRNFIQLHWPNFCVSLSGNGAVCVVIMCIFG